jgi:formylglycine-generating enzyme required for sulfatase activity/predicted MPP superfamily phosphohydrolase/energy-coupling factor transporter ATP-binding protein EcfA2
MSDILILHLSDIHFKNREKEDNKNFRKDVQKKLLEAVKSFGKKEGVPDVVAITGDIAFSGKAHEYEEAKDFFHELKSLLPAQTLFLAVPGNHDVDREKVKKHALVPQQVENNQVDSFLEDSDCIDVFINPKFAAFRDFCQVLNPEFYSTQADYFWVKNMEEKAVSFLGLNSAWASERDNDRFHIALGYPQVASALERASQSHRVLLMHHPLFNWLEEQDMNRWSGEVFHRCSLIVHGHVHRDSALNISTPSDSCIAIGANAAYTQDEGYIGFQFLKVRFSTGGVEVRAWPYHLETLERMEFRPHFSRWAGQQGKPYFDIATRPPCAGESPLRPLQIPAEYREWIVQFHSKMDTRQLDPNARAYHIPLPEVYIPIETANPAYKHEEETRRKGKGKDELMILVEGGEEDKEPPYIDIEALLGRRETECILLRGPAGMGKTTLVKHLAYLMTQGRGPGALCDYLPVVVFLKDLWPLFETMPPPVTFAPLLRRYLETRVPTLKFEAVEDFLARDRVLFLLDGLDEVPEQHREELAETLAAFQLEKKHNRYLLTGRPHGIDAPVTRHFGSFLRDIEPLDNKKVNGFVANWFRVVSGQTVGLADLTAAGMIGDIGFNPYVSVFTQNPLLLTAVCVLYMDNKRLPDQRAELYVRIVDNLIQRRFQQPAHREEPERIEDFLKLLAFHMQQRHVKSLDVGEAKQLLGRIFPRIDETPPQYRRKVDRLFEEIEPRCGLLKRPGEGEVEFLHLTFQEFLAARHLLYMEMDYKPYLTEKWWEETLLLYTGLVNREWKDRANRMVGEILDSAPGDAADLYRLWLLGAKALRDIQDYKRDAEVTARAREKLLGIIESAAPLGDRFDAGELLGLLDDPRIKNQPMQKIAAGQFTMGSEKGYDDEKPVHPVYLDEYMMGQYPVTNEEFNAFVEAGGYTLKDFWTPEGWQWREEEKITLPERWHESKWNRPNFPVVGVSWYEAAAYAAWLSKTTGKTYNLPSEAQWEKAARGIDSREYPWGDKYNHTLCNSRECQLERTNPVGIFPKGASPYGCLDMAGNVWEWCADWYRSNYHKQSPKRNPKGPKSRSSRVLRGGCWIRGASDCRSASRDGGYPALRLGYVGFRLVRSS